MKLLSQSLIPLFFLPSVGCVKPVQTKEWCVSGPITAQIAPEFLSDLLAENAGKLIDQQTMIAELKKQLRDDTLLTEQNKNSHNDHPEIFFSEGDTFPSLRIHRGQEDIEVRLDPHLRSLSILRLTKIAVSPDSRWIALVGDSAHSTSSFLVLLDSETLTSHVISENVYDVVWGDQSNLFFSTLQNQRPSAVYHYVMDGTSSLLRGSSSAQALLLSKSRDGSLVFMKVSGPIHMDIEALSSKSGFKKVFSRRAEPLGATVTAIRGAIFLLSFRDNPFGTVFKFNTSGSASPEVAYRGTSDAPITDLDSNNRELILFHSLGTQTSLTILDDNLNRIRAIPPLGPVSTLTPSPIVGSGDGGGVFVSSFLRSTQLLPLPQLDSWRADQPNTLGFESSLQVQSKDGVAIPVSLVRPPHPQGLLILVYGSYGRPFPATHSPYITMLLRNNIAVAIAHVRGGGDKGPAWHRAGTGRYRKRAIEDLVAVIRGLHARGIGDPTSTGVEGRSAGAWLAVMAAIRAPELMKSLILEAPFLDIFSPGRISDQPMADWDHAEWGDAASEVSPLDLMHPDFRAKTLTLIPIRDQLVPIRGTLEWIRRGRCVTNSPRNFTTVLLQGDTHEGPISRDDENESFAVKTAFIINTIAKDVAR